MWPLIQGFVRKPDVAAGVLTDLAVLTEVALESVYGDGAAALMAEAVVFSPDPKTAAASAQASSPAEFREGARGAPALMCIRLLCSERDAAAMLTSELIRQNHRCGERS